LIDKTTQTIPILLPLPNITSSIDIVAYTASAVDIAPYNMTPIGSIFPVQVNSNTTNMSVGITYYAKVFGTQSLQLNTNIDGGVPTIIDAADLASRPQPILSLITGYSPNTQTLTLNNALEITTNTYFSAVYSDSLVVQDITNSRQALTYAFKSVYQDNTEVTSTTISAPTASDNNVFYASGKTSNVLIEVDTPKITTTNGSDVSVLTATDLTFNGVSYSRELKIKQTNTILQNISPATYADGKAPTGATATIINTYAFFGWYFKNQIASQKINWYFGASSPTMTVADVLGLYMYYFNGATTSNDNTGFFTIYTQNDTPSPPNWYKSKRTYVFTQSITPIANTRYCMFMDVSGDCPNPAYYGQTLINMELSPVGSSNVGAFAPSEVILAFTIGSNSASAVNSVEFCVSKFGVMTEEGTQEFQLQAL
jgi:hypothetical protein